MAAFAIILVTRCEATPGWPGDPFAVRQRDCGPVEISALLGAERRMVHLRWKGRVVVIDVRDDAEAPELRDHQRLAKLGMWRSLCAAWRATS